MAKQWINFYAPDGRYLAGYTAAETFVGEMENTKELLASENGIDPGDIEVKLEGARPKK